MEITLDLGALNSTAPIIYVAKQTQIEPLKNTFVYVVEKSNDSKPVLDEMKKELQALKVKPTKLWTYDGTISDKRYDNEVDVKFHFVEFPDPVKEKKRSLKNLFKGK